MNFGYKRLLGVWGTVALEPDHLQLRSLFEMVMLMPWWNSDGRWGLVLGLAASVFAIGSSLIAGGW